MPKGPQGQARPAETVAAAVMVAKIATGEIEETLTQSSGRMRSGKAGAKARMRNTTASQRAEIARKAAETRWK